MRDFSPIFNLLQNFLVNDKLIILGDVKAREGRNSKAWECVFGKHGVGNCNNNGSLFPTWMYPQSKHLHLIDYVSVCRCDPGDVLHTRVIPSAECNTDHCLVHCKLN